MKGKGKLKSMFNIIIIIMTFLLSSRIFYREVEGDSHRGVL